MKIAYCTNVRLPSERAHGHQIAQVCDALSAQGHQVTVFAPFRRNPVRDSFHTYYDVSPDIAVKYLGTFDPINRWWLPGVLGLWTLNASLNKEYAQVLPESDAELLYTREPALLETLLASGKPVVVELHRLPSRSTTRFVEQCRRCRLVVCLTSVMKDELIRMGADGKNIIVEGDAYDASLFGTPLSRDKARKSYNIHDEIPVIAYAGQLASMGLSKGIPELLGALTILHKQGIRFRALIAGGPESAAAMFESSLPDSMRSSVSFLGMIDHHKIPTVLAASDVLIYPAPKSDHVFYNRDTSPLKIFEYMAANRPVVCADLPPLRDVVNAELVRLCPPGDSTALADGIRWVIDHPTEAHAMATKAHEQVKSRTWDARMARIIQAAIL